MYNASILAAIACGILFLVCEKRESSTNILFCVLFRSAIPLLNLSDVVCTKIVSFVGSSENLILPMMCSYLCYKSVLSDKNSARCVLALAIGSKFDGLVIEPKVPPRGTNKYFSIMKENAAAISG